MSKHITYFDASAAVKLAVEEPGSAHVRQHFQKHYRHYMTSLCFAEALGALKGKVQRKELSLEKYFYACSLLIDCLRARRFELEETLKISPETFSDDREAGEKAWPRLVGRSPAGDRPGREIQELGLGVQDRAGDRRPSFGEGGQGGGPAGLVCDGFAGAAGLGRSVR